MKLWIATSWTFNRSSVELLFQRPVPTDWNPEMFMYNLGKQEISREFMEALLPDVELPEHGSQWVLEIELLIKTI